MWAAVGQLGFDADPDLAAGEDLRGQDYVLTQGNGATARDDPAALVGAPQSR